MDRTLLTASGSSVFLPIYEAGKAIDGSHDPLSFFHSNPGKYEWIQVDFGRIVMVRRKNIVKNPIWSSRIQMKS